MGVSDKSRWRTWADRLRQKMMTELTPEVTKSISTIIEETGTERPQAVLRGEKFWTSCQAGSASNDALVSAGFEIEYEPNEEGEIDAVTLRLNDTWTSIMQRVLDRRAN